MNFDLAMNTGSGGCGSIQPTFVVGHPDAVTEYPGGVPPRALLDYQISTYSTASPRAGSGGTGLVVIIPFQLLLDVTNDATDICMLGHLFVVGKPT